MKKSLFILAAAAAFAITACDKNDDAKKVLDAEFTLANPIGTVVYGQPVELEGTAVSSLAIEKAIAMTVKDAENAGSEQELKIEGDKISGMVFIDSRDAVEIKVTLSAGDKSKDFSFPIEAINAPEKKDRFLC